MLLFLDISGGEILLILLAGMLLFGKDKLPGIIRGIARGADYIKKASEEVKQQINSETGIGETIDHLREDIGKATEEVKQNVRDMADPVDRTAEELKRQTDAGKAETPGAAPGQDPQKQDHVADA